MSDGNPSGYLPGDPRYGLQGEALKDYYRTKPAQWAIYCWDEPGTAETRRALPAEQKSYIKNFGERVIGYGHFVSDDGRDPLGTSFFMQLDDRAAADKFVADEPLNKAGVYQRVEIHRWSNSFGRRAADYRRKGCSSSCAPDPRPARLNFSASTCTPTNPTSHPTPTASSSAARSAPPTAPTTSAPRCCSNCRTGRRRTRSGTTSRLPGMAGISAMRGLSAGCLGIEGAIKGGSRVGKGHKDKVAVITGGANGIGQAFAKRLAEDGVHIAVADMADGGETVKLVEAAGRNALAVVCDVSSPNSVAAMAKRCSKNSAAPTSW